MPPSPRTVRPTSAMRASRVRLDLRFPIGVEPSVGVAALDGLSGLPYTSELIAEVVTGEDGVSHARGCHRRRLNRCAPRWPVSCQVCAPTRPHLLCVRPRRSACACSSLRPASFRPITPSRLRGRYWPGWLVCAEMRALSSVSRWHLEAPGSGGNRRAKPTTAGSRSCVAAQDLTARLHRLRVGSNPGAEDRPGAGAGLACRERAVKPQGLDGGVRVTSGRGSRISFASEDDPHFGLAVQLPSCWRSRSAARSESAVPGVEVGAARAAGAASCPAQGRRLFIGRDAWW